MANKHEQLEINRMIEGDGAIYTLWLQLTGTLANLVWSRINKGDSQSERLRIVMEKEIKATCG